MTSPSPAATPAVAEMTARRVATAKAAFAKMDAQTQADVRRLEVTLRMEGTGAASTLYFQLQGERHWIRWVAVAIRDIVVSLALEV